MFFKESSALFRFKNNIVDPEILKEVLEKLKIASTWDKILKDAEKNAKEVLKVVVKDKLGPAIDFAIDQIEDVPPKYTVEGQYFYDEFLRNDGDPGWGKIRVSKIAPSSVKNSIKTSIKFDIGIAAGIKGGLDVELGVEFDITVSLGTDIVNIKHPSEEHKPTAEIELYPKAHITLGGVGSIEAGIKLEFSTEVGYGVKAKVLKDTINADEETKEEVK